VIDRTQKEFSVTGGNAPGETSNLSARFLLAGGGAFGRDKAVSVDEATSALVSFRRDGNAVTDVTMTPSAAVELIEQTQRDTDAAASRAAAARQQSDAQLAEVRRKLAELACQVCGGRSFDEHISREDSQWGMTTFRMRLMICKQCGFVMQFALGRSLFVPGG
jgi:uncharacterized protein